MVEIIDTHTPHIFAVRVSGTLSEKEYNSLVPAMEARIAGHGKINLYWEMDNFSGWQPGALWEDLKFDVQHINHFDRIAVVGSKTWEKMLTHLMKPFTTADVRYFEHEARDAAREFVGL